MNFIDQIRQDQEEAKSALTAALNQKAFDLLDTYADNSEVEVVTFEDEEVANESVEELDEGLGSLAGLSKHLIKTVTKDPYSGRKAGEHSDVVTHPIKNKSAHREVLNKALDDGHVPVVYVNGKIHSAGHSTGSSYGRPEFHIHDADKQKEQKEMVHKKPYRSGGKFHYPAPHEISNPRYKKGDALDQLTPGHDASFYKENKVEVKVIKPDPERLKKMKARGENRPAMQANTVKMTPDEKKKAGYTYSDSKTVSHSPEGNMKAIKDAAALKLATKKLGTEGSSANKKAMDLHAELGKHLAAGKHTEAIRAANALSDHIRSQGLETHADKIKDYADTLKDLKNNWGNKDYAHQKLAKMRGEKTNEAEELVDALETMLTEMLDINEAVVAGSVKKDAKGNVLSFKSVGDKAKKLVTDRKTGKEYDPEEEFDKLIKKEEVEDADAEQIDELSKDTLSSYVDKSIKTFSKRVDAVTNPNSEKGKRKIDKVPGVGFLGFKNRNAKSLAKDNERERIAQGINTATAKLYKED